MQLSKKQNTEEYDEEPVYYCKRCLSLNIRQILYVANMDYCEDCGAVDIGTASIEEWDNLYKEKYGISFMDKSKKRK